MSLDLQNSGQSHKINFIVQFNDGLALFRYLIREIMTLRQFMLTVELEDIETETFYKSLTKHQICQYFPRQ